MQDKNAYPPLRQKPVYDFFKRFFDIFLCLLFILPLGLFALIVAIAIKLEDGGKVIYSSTRLTKGGRKFKMYKFRSMCPDAEGKKLELLDQNQMDGPAFKIENDPRITRVGKLIRKTSIDELPQILNVLKGDMSIIGPRPPLPEEVEQYTDYQKHRLDVKTGLACYHECLDRGLDTTFEEWVESDLRYIQERSLWTDFKIILLTVKAVLQGKGAM